MPKPHYLSCARPLIGATLKPKGKVDSMKSLMLLLAALTTSAQSVPHPSRPSPSPISVRPDAASRLSETFVAKWYDSKGGDHISHAFFTVQATDPHKRCAVRYDTGTNQFYLLDDSGNKYLGPMEGGNRDLGLGNQMCLLGVSTGSIEGNVLKLEIVILTTTGFVGNHRLYMSASDTGGKPSGRVPVGTWTVPDLSGLVKKAQSRKRPLLPAVPSDAGVPAPVPTLPGPFTATATFCDDASGEWIDPTMHGSWSLVEDGGNITGTLKVTSAECGTVSWKVNGKKDGKTARLRATTPDPVVDNCGISAADIEATLVPGCKAGEGSITVEPRKNFR